MQVIGFRVEKYDVDGIKSINFFFSLVDHNLTPPPSPSFHYEKKTQRIALTMQDTPNLNYIESTYFFTKILIMVVCGSKNSMDNGISCYNNMYTCSTLISGTHVEPNF